MTVTCRSCAAPLRTLFADLGMSPVSNAFRRQQELMTPEAFYPLRAFVCDRCKLVQLQDFAGPEQHFHDEYAYHSSFTPSWVEHARQFVDMAVRRFRLNASSFVVEVASNDGYLLQFVKAMGIPCLGVEPATNCAAAARDKFGVESMIAFFGSATAGRISEKYGKADLIIANNVLAHVPNLNDFISAFVLTLKPEGVASIEFPHLLPLMQNNQFDTIYHEHYSYLSYHSLAPLLDRHGLFVFDVEQLGTHGGSLRLFVGNKAVPRLVSETVAKLADEEKHAGLHEIDAYLLFAGKVAATKRKLQRLLNSLKEQGATIAGYGAPAKGNTLLNYCGVRTDIIDFTVDRSTVKQGCYLPGTQIPVLPVEAVKERRPDYLLILPWNSEERDRPANGFHSRLGRQVRRANTRSGNLGIG